MTNEELRKDIGLSMLDQVSVLVLEDDLSLSRALKQLKISRWSFYQHAKDDPEFARRLNELRELSHDLMEDMLLDISDDAQMDDKLRKDKLDTRKWILARRVARFRDKSELDVTSKGERILVLDL
jgi:hypothetical protein